MRVLPLQCLKAEKYLTAESLNVMLLCLDILNELLQRENRVLHFWTMRKRRLDQCQQYVVFERSAKQVKTHISIHSSFWVKTGIT